MMLFWVLSAFLGSITITVTEEYLVKPLLHFYLVKRDHQEDFSEREAMDRGLCNLEHCGRHPDARSAYAELS